jgi:hypothetical protein
MDYKIVVLEGFFFLYSHPYSTQLILMITYYSYVFGFIGKPKYIHGTCLFLRFKSTFNKIWKFFIFY